MMIMMCTYIHTYHAAPRRDLPRYCVSHDAMSCHASYDWHAACAVHHSIFIVYKATVHTSCITNHIIR